MTTLNPRAIYWSGKLREAIDGLVAEVHPDEAMIIAAIAIGELDAVMPGVIREARQLLGAGVPPFAVIDLTSAEPIVSGKGARA